MTIEEQLQRTTRIALEALEHLREIEEVSPPNAERKYWIWRNSGDALADIQECPPLLIKDYTYVKP